MRRRQHIASTRVLPATAPYRQSIAAARSEKPVSAANQRYAPVCRIDATIRPQFTMSITYGSRVCWALVHALRTAGDGQQYVNSAASCSMYCRLKRLLSLPSQGMNPGRYGLNSNRVYTNRIGENQVRHYFFRMFCRELALLGSDQQQRFVPSPPVPVDGQHFHHQ